MSHWGWRRILTCFVSVLVVGCSATYESAPTLFPTPLPQFTLVARGFWSPTPPPPTQTPLPTPSPAPTALVYTIQPGDTLLGIASTFGVSLDVLQAANGDLNPLTLPIGASITIPDPPFTAEGVPRLPTLTPVDLVVLPPVCHPTATDGILCLGRVLNTRDVGVQRVNMALQLLRADGTLLAAGEAGIEQAFIPAGGSAPYRALFKVEWHDFAGAVVRLQSADLEAHAEEHYITLDIQNQQAHMVNGQYEVSATLHNPETQNARLIQAVLTVEDASGQIVGYRVLPFAGELNPGSNLSIQISVMAAAAVTHSLYVEAERES